MLRFMPIHAPTLLNAGWAVGALVASGVLCALLLPVAARVAVKVGAIDHPGGRRTHSSAVPRLGGVAVVGAAVLTTLAGALLTDSPAELLPSPQNQALAMGAALIFALGLLDDLRGASPRLKLLVQVVAALLVVQAGGLADTAALVRGVPTLPLDGLMAPLLVLWIVGVTNAFNLIDGLDGLAGVCALVALGTMAVSGSVLDQPTSFLLTSALLGALAAFLKRNWHPATMFLGDSGSMTLGFVLAVRVIPSASSADGTLHALVPLAALAYPVLDTLTSMLRRRLRGQPFSRADGRHIHHQLVTIGLSVPRAVAAIGTTAVVVALAGLTVSYAPPAHTVIAAVAVVMAMGMGLLYLIWRLEYTEFIAFGKSVFSGVTRSGLVVSERIRIGDLVQQINRTTTEAEMRQCLRGLIDFEHVRRVELVDPVGSVKARHEVHASMGAATSDSAAPTNPLPDVWMECPVHRHSTGHVLLLRVRVTPHGMSNHTPQRVHHMVGPALERWFGQHDDQVGSVTAGQILSTRPTSGPPYGSLPGSRAHPRRDVVE